jgi:hypothetical protein
LDQTSEVGVDNSEQSKEESKDSLEANVIDSDIDDATVVQSITAEITNDQSPLSHTYKYLTKWLHWNFECDYIECIH